MRKLKKRLAALGVGLTVMAASAMSLGASASATIVSWNNFFTPYDGSFYASNTVLRVSGLKWSADQQATIDITLKDSASKATAEFEYRPKVYGTGTHTIWSAVNGNTSSNLPSAYYEFQWYDDDDVAIGCGSLQSCLPGISYYGSMYMTPASTAPTGNTPYLFECELGADMLIDSLPLYIAEYPQQPAYFNTTYSW